MSTTKEKDENTQTSEKKKNYTVIFYLKKDRCKGCGFCVEFCPTGALSLSHEFNEKGYHPPYMKYPEKCTACNLCAMYCPDFAIHIEKKRLDDV